MTGCALEVSAYLLENPRNSNSHQTTSLFMNAEVSELLNGSGDVIRRRLYGGKMLEEDQ